MTEQEFITTIEETGATGVRVRSETLDWGDKLGVVVAFHRDGTLHRKGVCLASDRQIEDAFPVLLDWVRR